MSLKYNVNELNNTQLTEINDNLKIEIENSKYNKFAPKKTIEPFYIDLGNQKIYVPFSYGFSVLKLPRRERSSFPTMNVMFEGELREEQEIIKKESITQLNKKGSIIISLYTGGGKTITSINLACSIKLKTLVIVNKIVLLNQWEESIQKFCPSASILKLVPNAKMKEHDFCIVNAINIPKKPRDFFKDYGLVICDEVHLIMAESLSKCLLNIQPRYLIGLSATPYRTDGLDKLLDFYFGDYKIVRLLKREHTVYKVKTGFTPTVELAENGKVNWNVLITSQAMDKDRNELIVKIAKQFNERNILIMSKRIEQAKYIFSRLEEDGESVTNLIGKKQDYDKDARILVAVASKTGTGFDHPKMDCLILASDLENYFIQVLGRVLRTKEVKPIIFDLLDENKILDKHFKTRNETYKEVGGKIINFKV